MDNVANKRYIKLYVDGQLMGDIADVQYRREAVRLGELNGFEQFAPGNDITVDVELIAPLRFEEKYRLLDAGEQLRLTDEWYSNVEMKWFPISMFRQDLDGQFSDGDLYRRKALVLV